MVESALEKIDKGEVFDKNELKLACDLQEMDKNRELYKKRLSEKIAEKEHLHNIYIS